MNRLRTLLGGAFALIVLAVAAVNIVASSAAVCGACHEMAPRTEAWRESSHAGVACVRCHASPGPWTALPQVTASRAALLGRDLLKHAAGGYQDPVETRRAGVAPMGDEVCLQCHDVNRKATSGFRIRIEHAEHAKRNKSCVSCHVRTAHPKETRGKALSLMGQCFNCHGSEDSPEASAECRSCHPSDFELRPESHETAKWQRGHGVPARADRRQCDMCHEQKMCDRCHGVEMPHPAGWEQGKTGHATVVAKQGRATCSKCHREKPDLCSMCHHKAYDPSKGSWQKQHFIEVQRKGASFCLDCHSPLYCARCHVGG